MSLRRKMTLQIAAMVGGLLLVIAAALWGLNGLRGDFGVATSGYRQLRDVYEVASHVATAKTLLTAGARDRAAQEVDRALTRLDVFLSHQAEQGSGALTVGPSLRHAIEQADAALRLPPDEAFHSSTRSQLDALDGVLGQVARFALDVRQSIETHERAAAAKWRATLGLVAAVSLVIVLVTVWLGVRQYRSVSVPLVALRDAADRFAAGQLSDRIDARPLRRRATEFAQLAEHFNRMARELEALYQDLERKVADKSRELVRSERLASVGYLAAGVAHEINNPLSIITGYGERAAQQLAKGRVDDPGTAAALKALNVMCEEAYRCKAITDRLLSMARPGEEARGPVALADVARDVVALVTALPVSRGRTVTLAVEEQAKGATVVGAAGELKQVLLNLVLNGLEAAEPDRGEVRVNVSRTNEAIQLAVEDNGRGMSPATLERVFEPFFTEKRGVQGAGTGLGLSISHAIVESHGGHLRAASDGPGQGSRLVMELPLAAQNDVVAAAKIEGIRT